MKSLTKYPAILTIIFLFFTFNLSAQEREMQGFIDENQDGINDIFRDSNGDGINDITQQPYQHNFKFQDKNQDGINDLFVDDDGDGVNDLARQFVDHDQDGWNDNVIDYNRDWINDITGMIYNQRQFHGNRYGIMLEEMGARIENYTDDDNDGRYDNMRQYRRGMMQDRFIDENGDGIFDGRGFNRHGRKNRQNKGRN
jgi:hypothetical protein